MALTIYDIKDYRQDTDFILAEEEAEYTTNPTEKVVPHYRIPFDLRIKLRKKLGLILYGYYEFIWEKTIGYKKPEDAISVSQFQEYLCVIGRQNVRSNLKKLQDLKLIIVKDGNQLGEKSQAKIYSINIATLKRYEIENYHAFKNINRGYETYPVRGYETYPTIINNKKTVCLFKAEPEDTLIDDQKRSHLEHNPSVDDNTSRKKTISSTSMEISGKNYEGKIWTIRKSDYHYRIAREKLNLPNDEIEYGWEALSQYKGIINDWWAFAKGAIKKYQARKITTQNKSKLKQGRITVREKEYRKKTEPSSHREKVKVSKGWSKCYQHALNLQAGCSFCFATPTYLIIEKSGEKFDIPYSDNYEEWSKKAEKIFTKIKNL